MTGAEVVIEQPQNSLMQEHPRFQALIQWLKSREHPLRRTMVWMSAYGASSPKPTWLYMFNEAIGVLGTKQKAKKTSSRSSNSKPMTKQPPGKTSFSMSSLISWLWVVQADLVPSTASSCQVQRHSWETKSDWGLWIEGEPALHQEARIPGSC